MSGPKKDLIFLMDDPEDDRYNINDLVLQNPYTPNDQFLSYFNKNSKYGKNVPAGFLFIEASKKLMQKLQLIIKNGKSVMTHEPLMYVYDDFIIFAIPSELPRLVNSHWL